MKICQRLLWIWTATFWTIFKFILWKWRVLRGAVKIWMRTPLKKCSLTADDGASSPAEWCSYSGEIVHGGRRRGAPGHHARKLLWDINFEYRAPLARKTSPALTEIYQTNNVTLYCLIFVSRYLTRLRVVASYIFNQEGNCTPLERSWRMSSFLTLSASWAMLSLTLRGRVPSTGHDAAEEAVGYGPTKLASVGVRLERAELADLGSCGEVSSTLNTSWAVLCSADTWERVLASPLVARLVG